MYLRKFRDATIEPFANTIRQKVLNSSFLGEWKTRSGLGRRHLFDALGPNMSQPVYLSLDCGLVDDANIFLSVRASERRCTVANVSRLGWMKNASQEAVSQCFHIRGMKADGLPLGAFRLQLWKDNGCSTTLSVFSSQRIIIRLQWHKALNAPVYNIKSEVFIPLHCHYARGRYRSQTLFPSFSLRVWPQQWTILKRYPS